MCNQDTYGTYQTTVSVFQRRPITTALSEDPPHTHTHTICDVCDHIRREQNLLIPQDGQCVVDLVCSSGLQVGDGLHLLELREWLSPDGVLSILRQHPTC